MVTPQTIQDAMSELLSALGFDAMAREVKTEQELDRLRTYARIIVKNTGDADKRLKLANLFRLHHPSLY